MPADGGDLHGPPLVDGLRGLPTCGLAITESERALPGIIDQLEAELAKLGLAQEQFTRPHDRLPQRLRAAVQFATSAWSARPRTDTRSSLGGRLVGDRLNFIYKDLVPAAEIVPTLVPLFVYFRQRSLGR